MRICHFSDQHWMFFKLPEADLYVCTGDEYDNYPKARRLSKEEKRYKDWSRGEYEIVPDHEKFAQEVGAQKLLDLGGFKQYLGSPDAPIVCVKGNHDFADLKHLFKGCNLVHEFINNEVIEVAGLKVTGHRGVPTINGAWADETPRPDLVQRFRDMDLSCDLFLTHYPLDGTGLSKIWGLEGVLGGFLYSNTAANPLHCFGHVHEASGVVQLSNVTFSNAAETYNVFEGDPETGWMVK